MSCDDSRVADAEPSETSEDATDKIYVDGFPPFLVVLATSNLSSSKSSKSSWSMLILSLGSFAQLG
jgi:hypothetical protein